jgi:hypothetical protein
MDVIYIYSFSETSQNLLGFQNLAGLNKKLFL